MKKKFYIYALMLCALTAVSCIKEGLEPCPADAAGPVSISVQVEKFRTRPPYKAGDMEDSFMARVHSMSYLLYADGRLIEQGTLNDANKVSAGEYVFRHDPLPFGSYRIAFIANTSDGTMVGGTTAPETYYFPFDENNSNDYFRESAYFDVTCPIRNDFEVVLQRVYGVARFNFEDMPADITAIEVTFDNVGERMPVCGDPDKSCTVSKHIDVSSFTKGSSGSSVLGTFCTLPGTKTSWRMKVYEKGSDTPVYDKVVRNDLTVECNQLIDLTAGFKNWDDRREVEFTVDVDTAWDGSNTGGGGTTVTEIQ